MISNDQLVSLSRLSCELIAEALMDVPEFDILNHSDQFVFVPSTVKIEACARLARLAHIWLPTMKSRVQSPAWSRFEH